MANKLFNFIGETKSELKKVTWPTRQEVIGSTVVTLVVTLLVALYVGVFDFIFSQAIRILIG